MLLYTGKKYHTLALPCLLALSEGRMVCFCEWPGSLTTRNRWIIFTLERGLTCLCQIESAAARPTGTGWLRYTSDSTRSWLWVFQAALHVVHLSLNMRSQYNTPIHQCKFLKELKFWAALITRGQKPQRKFGLHQTNIWLFSCMILTLTSCLLQLFSVWRWVYSKNLSELFY